MNFLIRFITGLITFFALFSAAHGSTIQFNDEVSIESMNKLVANIAKATAAGDRNITIELNSGGGNLGSALWAAGRMKAYGVNTLVRHECASSCTVLFAAGKSRTASSDANFMFHGVNVEHIDRKLRKNGMTNESVSQDYANQWLGAVRAASPTLADQLASKNTLRKRAEWNISGRQAKTFGYVND